MNYLALTATQGIKQLATVALVALAIVQNIFGSSCMPAEDSVKVGRPNRKKKIDPVTTTSSSIVVEYKEGFHLGTYTYTRSIPPCTMHAAAEAS